MKRVHYYSGLVISVFVGIHLFNHVCSIWGANLHIELMSKLRFIYRNGFVESTLVLAISIQVYSGLTLFWQKRKRVQSFFEKLHIWSGLYMALFFIIHLSAVFVGRWFLLLDTNFYFGVAGLNTFPANLFFVPYYGLAILSFFGHLAAIHAKKMERHVLGLAPLGQAKVILFLGVGLTVLIFYGLTNEFKGVEIPKEYKVLVGK